MQPHPQVAIVSGGALGEWALADIRQADIRIGADRGALFLLEHGFAPDLALGDFDSVSASERERIRSGSREFSECDPVDKDWTDTELAFRRAVAMAPREITLIGALGSRLDHSLANVHLLRTALERNIACCIVDKNNRVYLTDRTLQLRRGVYSHVSLLPLTPEVRGITLTGFQYPLREATLTIGQSLGISNMLLEDEGIVEVGSGQLLVIQSVD